MVHGKYEREKVLITGNPAKSVERTWKVTRKRLNTYNHLKAYGRREFS